MRTLLPALLATLACWSLGACVTAGGGSARQNKTLDDQGQAKAGDKGDTPATPAGAPSANSPGASDATTPDGGDAATSGAPSITEQLAFVKTHATPGTEYGEAEHQFAAALPNGPEPGSITEAAVVIGLLRTVLNPPSLDTITFKEADIDPAGDASDGTVKTPSLELLARERGVNLPDALVENPLLTGYGVAKQAAVALQASTASPDFKVEIVMALRRQAGLWTTLQADLAAAETPATPVEEDPGEAPNPADLMGGDAVLSEAQALADRGNYRAAIRKASLVGPQSPMRPMAEEKIREFSKTAVQELRSKAAQAFQSAAPVTDPKTKVGYLKQARTFLEEAIKNYPEAPQLPTVRDNLRAISRDLEKLEAEKGH